MIDKQKAVELLSSLRDKPQPREKAIVYNNLITVENSDNVKINNSKGGAITISSAFFLYF